MPSLLSIGCDNKIVTSLSNVNPPIRTIEGFLERNMEALSVESGLSIDVYNICNMLIYNEQLLNNLKSYLIEKYSVKCVNGVSYLLKAKSMNMIFPLNIESIDMLLDNGIYSNYISEFSGVSVSGKSSLCHSISYNVIKNDGNVIYVDSCNNFDIFKIIKQIGINTVYKYIIHLQNINNKIKLLENIRIKHIFRLSDLKLYLLSIINNIECNNNIFYNNLRIIIIDSINPILLSNQYDNNEYRNSIIIIIIVFICIVQQDIIILNQLFHEICLKYNIGIILINSASYNINNDNKMEYKVGNGIIWSYVSDREYLLENLSNNLYKISVLKGPNMNMSCEYHINEDGIIY